MNTVAEAAKHLRDAESILIGASNGVSIAEGLNLFAHDEAFIHNFGDFAQAYGILNIIQGSMYPFPDPESAWAWWSRFIWLYRGLYRPTSLMWTLRQLVGERPYFIVTTNGEMHFVLSGFDPGRIYEIEGSVANTQCSVPCHDTLYPLPLPLVEQMNAEQKDLRVPSSLIPRCPKCGAPMRPNVETDETFIPNHAQRDALAAFLERVHLEKIVLLELGVGARNQLIRPLFYKIADMEPHSFLIEVNMSPVPVVPTLAARTCILSGDVISVLEQLLTE